MKFQATIRHSNIFFCHIIHGIDKALLVAAWVQRVDSLTLGAGVLSLHIASTKAAWDHVNIPSGHHVKKQQAAWHAERTRQALITALEGLVGQEFPA